MNYTEIITRISLLEERVKKIAPEEGEVTGKTGAQAIRLVGITTAQRTTLGIHLATLDEIQHQLVYDTEKESFYVWSGSEWI